MSVQCPLSGCKADMPPQGRDYESLTRGQNMGRALGRQQFLDRLRQESLGR